MAFARTALAVALVAACTDKPPGRKLASGIASRLTVRDGHVAFLVDAVHPDDRTIPEDLVAGDLWLDDRKLGSGVSSQPGMFAFSPNGRLAFLASWRFRAGEGELWTDAGQVAKAARSFAWSPDGSTLAYVAPGRVGIGDKSLPLEGVQEIAWSPDGKRLAARTSASAGGKLYIVENMNAREVAPGTTDFAFSPTGVLAALGPPPPKGGDRPLLVEGKEVGRATAFAFSPDGSRIALFSTAKQPGEATGDLYRLSGGKEELVAQKVSDWRWDAGGDLLCLARYDLRARAGTLVADGREIASKVQSFSAFGRKVLYLVQSPQKGDFKIELWGVDLATDKPPHKIDEGVYGWDLSADTLYYKARCAGGPRSCALLETTFAGTEKPVLLAPDVAGFDLSHDGSRILVQKPHRGAARAVDLAVIPSRGGPLQTLVEEVDPSSRFADARGTKVVYALSKGGVYVADVP
jgi:hypothetical protein